MFKKLKSFLLSVWSEYRNVTWSSRREIVDVTVLVVYLVLFFSVYIGLVDYFLMKFVGILLRFK